MLKGEKKSGPNIIFWAFRKKFSLSMDSGIDDEEAVTWHLNEVLLNVHQVSRLQSGLSEFIK